MRVEFRQGVPEGCTEWLWDNVGPGNVGNSFTVQVNGIRDFISDFLVDTSEYAWFYERVPILPDYKARHPDDILYVPTITIKDAKMATLFALRWQK